MQAWRKKHARGDVVVVRYADDTVLGFQSQTEADRFLEDFRERLGKFGLELHPDKTRRIEFGRYAESNRKRRGEGKPETFDFLGFTHISGKTRKGAFTVRRKTIRKRLGAKLQEIKQQLRRRMHDPVAQTGEWLRSVVQGYFNYHAVPRNLDSLQAFRDRVTRLWRQTLRRRGQKRPPNWTRLHPWAERWIPHPSRAASLSRATLRRQPSEIRASCGRSARGDLCGGYRATGIPTATGQCFSDRGPFPLKCRSHVPF